MKKYFPFLLKLLISIIMIQTLFFKFTGAQESIELFTKLAGKNEAFMRIITGILEFVAVVLLFTPKHLWLGAVLTIGLMSGAITAHLTKLGIEHNNDGGILFISATVTLFSAIILIFVNRKKIL
ncbi:DoxX family protein [Tenacibaculum sp. AHE15PA]|uniref:DoxX family membrane protein n=1 Tax=Tenacibaculum TaxID=104267 RepID=UPI001C500D0D|nr:MULTISPECIES: DoxX family protein [Tenacibaculum]QXP74099.1 DoxX family protein [Tenacibaculum sp. AHE14PA]QXP75533.1 DoxX family protein [Tenacibaculum sp. AHE15PA]